MIERRRFPRFNCKRPIAYKRFDLFKGLEHDESLSIGICKNISISGMLFASNAVKIPSLPSVLTVSFDYTTTEVAEEIEKRNLVENDRLFAKVVRIANNGDGTCDIGIAFITKTEHLSKEIKHLILNGDSINAAFCI